MMTTATEMAKNKGTSGYVVVQDAFGNHKLDLAAAVRGDSSR